ncbi:MAG: RtcB family protein, partial [Defluviimonas sp.]|nr:RtcB family protein [Defluviimonas sp.]
DIPSGVGSTGLIKLGKNDTAEVLEKGALWAVENGYGWPRDLDHTEERGVMKGAQAGKVSDKAIKRGMPQLGTLGSGNHFLEVQVVDEVFDGDLAERFGLAPGQIAVMIHSGSRGLGHQVCTDYLATMEQAIKKYGITIPDRHPRAR